MPPTAICARSQTQSIYFLSFSFRALNFDIRYDARFDSVFDKSLDKTHHLPTI